MSVWRSAQLREVLIRSKSCVGVWQGAGESLIACRSKIWSQTVSTTPVLSNKLDRQPKGPDFYKDSHVATPPVSTMEGMRLPTAAQWMKRRGPALPNNKISRLFRTRHIRFHDPETNLVHRAKRDRVLQPGSKLLVPKFAFSRDVERLSDKTLKARKRDPESLEIWEDLRKRVLYSDEDLHILNKPARLVVQGSKRVSLAGLIQSGLSFAETDITKLVHRLDKDTSGAMIIARNRDAAAWIGEAFVQRSRQSKDPSYQGIPGLFIEKIYWAVVESFDRQESEGVIDALVMSEHNGKPFSVPARSEFKVMACSNRLAWLELKPITGKKHQLRLHCSQNLGSPIKGDVRYGAILEDASTPGVGPDSSTFLRSQTPKICLHSRSVVIRRPGKPDCKVTAPLPPHMQRIFEAQGWQEKEHTEPSIDPGAVLNNKIGPKSVKVKAVL